MGGRGLLPFLLNSGRKAICTGCNTTTDLTADHIVPIKRGGPNKLSNLQVLCQACNGWKADQLYPENYPIGFYRKANIKFQRRPDGRSGPPYLNYSYWIDEK